MLCIYARKEKFEEALLSELLSPGEQKLFTAFLQSAADITAKHGVPLEKLTVLPNTYGEALMAVIGGGKSLTYVRNEDWFEARFERTPPGLWTSAYFASRYCGDDVRKIDSILEHEAGHLVGKDHDFEEGHSVLTSHLDNLAFVQTLSKISLSRHLDWVRENFESTAAFYDDLKRLDKALAPCFSFAARHYGASPDQLCENMAYGSRDLEYMWTLLDEIPHDVHLRVQDISAIRTGFVIVVASGLQGSHDERSLDAFSQELRSLDERNALLSKAGIRKKAFTQYCQAFATSRELAADQFAAVHAKSPEDFIDAITQWEGWEKINEKSGEFDPHPPIAERVARIKRIFSSGQSRLVL